jgi:hypothetical protein
MACSHRKPGPGRGLLGAPRTQRQTASRDHSILGAPILVFTGRRRSVLWLPSRHRPCAWLSDRAGQRLYPLSGPRRGAPSRGAHPPELGPVAQAGVRDRPGTLPPLRRPLDDHRRHRTSPRHCEDPRPPRLVRPGPAPIACAVIRSIPNGTPPTRFHSLSRQPPLAGTRPRGQNAPGPGPLEPRKGPEHPASWTDGSCH